MCRKGEASQINVGKRGERLQNNIWGAKGAQLQQR